MGAEAVDADMMDAGWLLISDPLPTPPPVDDGGGISKETCAVRVWRREADRRVIPERRPTTSWK